MAKGEIEGGVEMNEKAKASKKLKASTWTQGRS